MKKITDEERINFMSEHPRLVGLKPEHEMFNLDTGELMFEYKDIRKLVDRAIIDSFRPKTVCQVLFKST